MTQKQTDARRMLKCGAPIKEIQTYLRRIYGSGLHTVDLAMLRRGKTPPTRHSRGVKARVPKAKPEARAKAEPAQLTMAVDAQPSGARTIMLHPDGTWTFGD